MKIFKNLVVLSAVLSVLSIAATAQKLKAEDVIARHLDSIGTAEARAAVKNMIAVGDATAQFVSTKNQPVQGRAVFASEGQKSFIGMTMNSSLYPSERFIYDGKKLSVAAVQVNSRSVLGNFL